VSPERLIGMATAYWPSMTLLALNELGVFTALADGDRSGGELAEATGSDARALRLLLNAGVAHDLLTKDGDSYANGAEAGAFLVPGGPGFMGGAFRYAYDVYGAWGGLVESVRTGDPGLPEEEYLGGDPARTERFVRAMHGRGMGWGRGIAHALDLAGRASLLDVAGGSGTYSILLCERTPGLSSTVCDLRPILDVSERIIAEHGLSDRVATHAWDLRTDALPEGRDAALVSGLLHRLPPDVCAALVSRVHAALSPGAVVALADVMLDETGAGPPQATLFALNMLLTAPGGGAHRDVDHVAWLEAAGFVDAEIRRLPAPAQHTVVLARKA